MKFNTLSLQSVIVHQVPAKNDGSASGPVLSEAPSPTNTRVFQFFRQRMSGVMANKGLPIEPDVAKIGADGQIAIVLKALQAFVDDPTKLVSASREVCSASL